jgi:hypothetical protein
MSWRRHTAIGRSHWSHSMMTKRGSLLSSHVVLCSSWHLRAHTQANMKGDGREIDERAATSAAGQCPDSAEQNKLRTSGSCRAHSGCIWRESISYDAQFALPVLLGAYLRVTASAGGTAHISVRTTSAQALRPATHTPPTHWLTKMTRSCEPSCAAARTMSNDRSCPTKARFG